MLYMGNHIVGKTSGGDFRGLSQGNFYGAHIFGPFRFSAKQRGASPAKGGEAAAGATRSGLFVFRAIHITQIS